jgi:hypothetical protein
VGKVLCKTTKQAHASIWELPDAVNTTCESLLELTLGLTNPEIYEIDAICKLVDLI